MLPLSAQEILLLKQRRPSGQEDRSTLSALLQPWWTWAAQRLPPSVAPNALTVAGSVAVVIPTVIQVVLSPDLRMPQPWWSCVLAILGVFVFQTLDALDGKQARRTGTSSPLGSWLDHALDILTLNLAIVGLCASMGTGTSLVLWFVLASALLNNYLLHWEVHYTRCLVLGNGTSITEAQVLIMVVHGVAAVTGTAWWQEPRTWLWGYPIHDVFQLVAIVSVAYTGMVASVMHAWKAMPVKNVGALLHALLDTWGMVALGIITGVGTAMLQDGVARMLVLLSGVFLASRLVAELVLANLVDRKPPQAQWPLGLLAVAVGVAIGMQSVWVAAAGFVVSMAVTLHTLVVVTSAMARALEAPILRMPRREQHTPSTEARV